MDRNRIQIVAGSLILLLPLFGGGCSIKGMAMNGIADALAGSGGGGRGNVYLSDEDPVLVGEALPFSLKLMETVLQEKPEHEGLLLACATGFVSYAEMWVLRPARHLEMEDYAAFKRGRARAKALFLRARGYAGRALDVRHPGIAEALRRNPDSAVGQLREDDLPGMYWFAASHGRAIWTDLSDAQLVVEAPTLIALLDRGLSLDESWNRGAFHELYIGIPELLGGGPEKAMEHYEKAMELNGGASVGPMVSLAEAVYLPEQDREAFTQVLNEALAFDPDQFPDTRLANVLAQEQAAWLLSRADELFWTESAKPTSQRDAERMRIP